MSYIVYVNGKRKSFGHSKIQMVNFCDQLEFEGYIRTSCVIRKGVHIEHYCS